MSAPYILVIDDEPDIRRLVQEILEDEGYAVAVAASGEQARQRLRGHRPDLVLLDIWMPDIDGITLFKEVLAGTQIPVIVMSGHGTVETAVEATRLGAAEFIEKPLSLAKLLPAVEMTLAASAAQGNRLAPRTEEPVIEPLGRSRALQHLREQIKRVAQHDDTVLLVGEAGSGKALFARYLHTCSPRRDGPFIELKLSALPDDAVDVLLFGREEPGRVVAGYLERARGGTLYLADVAEAGRALQAALLSVLAARSFHRMGGATPLPLEARFVCGTAQDLDEAVREGRLREDLYYQLNVVPLVIPPLREHREDVSDLLAHFVHRLVQHEGLSYRSFTLPAQNRLRHHSWPGNVRELENLVRRLLILGSGPEIDLAEVDAALSALPHPLGPGLEIFDLPLREARECFERAYLEYQLQQTGGSVGQVAKLAGMERTHLYRKLRALGIDAKQK